MIATLYGLFMCSAVAAAPEPGYLLEIQPSRRIEAEFTYSMRFPGFRAKEWILFVAQPPELPSQTKLSATMEPTPRAVKDLSGWGRPVYLARVSVVNAKGEDSFAVKVKYQANLLSRRLVQREAGKTADAVVALSPVEQKAALAPSAHNDFQTPEFQKWLDSHKLRRGTEEEIDFARRAFLTISKNYTYNYQPNLERQLSKFCNSKSTDCGGMSLVFCAAMRANKIPARVLVGRWAKSEEKEATFTNYQTHIKAEFYAKGVGWVPVDPSAAVQFDKSKDGLVYFGNDPGDFLTMHADADLIVNTETVQFKTKTITFLQGVSFWMSGTGPTDKGETKESWQVKRVEK